MFSLKSNYLVPKVLEQLSKEENIDNVILNENKLACMFASPILFLVSIVNIIIRYGILKEAVGDVLFDSGICIILSLCFELVLRSKRKPDSMVNLVAALYGTWTIFVFIRFSRLFGPFVWYAGFILLLLSMFQVKKNMLVLVGSIILFNTIQFFQTGMYEEMLERLEVSNKK